MIVYMLPHLASVRFEHSACHGSLIITYITLLALLVEHFLVHWYQQFVTVHHVPKCMSCYKAIVVITGRAHCFHDCIYVTPILLLWDLSTLCGMDHLWPLIYIWYIYIYIIYKYIMCVNKMIYIWCIWHIWYIQCCSKVSRFNILIININCY